MSHTAQREFITEVKTHFPQFFTKKRVLEVGSLNINGTLRDFFSKCDYTGIDVGEGEGVDIVCEGQKYEGPDNSFDVCASAECFEHNPYWIATFSNMIRLCKPGGLVVMTCATTGRSEHGTRRTSPNDSPLTLNWDYYKNLTEKDFTTNFAINDIFSDYKFSVDAKHKDLFFWGIVK